MSDCNAFERIMLTSSGGNIMSVDLEVPVKKSTNIAGLTHRPHACPCARGVALRVYAASSTRHVSQKQKVSLLSSELCHTKPEADIERQWYWRSRRAQGMSHCIAKCFWAVVSCYIVCFSLCERRSQPLQSSRSPGDYRSLTSPPPPHNGDPAGPGCGSWS